MESSERVTGKINLAINGVPIQMDFAAPAGPVKPHRMLPIFQGMSNMFVDMGVQGAEGHGKKISCGPKCTACCFQPVPILELEVYQLSELVEAMPEPRRSEIKRRFSDAVDRFAGSGWLDKLDALSNTYGKEPVETVTKGLQTLGIEYYYERVACPFLEDGLCSIHENRPLSCREYLATSPAANCSLENGGPIVGVDLPVEVSKVVGQIAKSGRMADFGFVPLILALEQAEKLPEQLEEKKATDWINEFFKRFAESRAVSEKHAETPGGVASPPSTS
ncbi:MAG: YkgJ family cysteine cluster protein [Acidobacteriota bacterium]